MSTKSILAAILMVGLAGCASVDSSFKNDFSDEKEFTSVGANTYWILKPGYVLELQNKDASHKLRVSVLNETRMVDGVETRIVEEREWEDGQLVEVSRNYFALSKRTNNLYYFGEDVDIYKDGKVASHDGSWHSGVDGAKFGLMIPGKPEVGMKFMQEVAPEVALDRFEVASTTLTYKVPAGEFRNCLKSRESSGLESGTEYKIYAPGVGLIHDDDVDLVKPAGAASDAVGEVDPNDPDGSVRMKLDKVPAAVMATFKKNAEGEPIKIVDMEVHDGKKIYDTDVWINGQKTAIIVAEDGKLISKKAEGVKKKK